MKQRIIILLLSICTLNIYAQDSTKALLKPFDKQLFEFKAKYGPLTKFERAERANARIQKFSQDIMANTDSILVLKDSNNMFEIVYDTEVLFSIVAQDFPNDTAINKAAMVEAMMVQMRTNISEQRDVKNWKSIALDISLVLVILLVLFFVIKYILKLFVYTKGLIEKQKDKLLKGIQIRNYELFSAQRQVDIALLLNKGIQWLVILLVVYLAAPLVFSIFPSTQSFSNKLIGYFVNPFVGVLKSIWAYIPNLITIVVIIFVFRYVLRGITYLKVEVATGKLTLSGFYPDWAEPTYQIIRTLVLAFMIIVIYPYLPGSDSAIFQGVSVFLGFLFTFGSSGSLSNIISGIVLTYMRAYHKGDRVTINNVTGDVVEKTLLVTRLRTIKNEDITIPNSQILNNYTVNFSTMAKERGLILHTTITIGYDVPWKKVHQMLIDAALKTDKVNKEPKPFVLQTSLDDFYVSYQLNAYTNHASAQAVIYSDLHAHIQDEFNANEVEILSPHFKALRDGSHIQIPADYISKGYEQPPFVVKNKA